MALKILRRTFESVLKSLMPNAIFAMYHDTASQHCFMRLVTREKLFSQKQAAILKTGKQIKLKSDYNTNTK